MNDEPHLPYGEKPNELELDQGVLETVHRAIATALVSKGTVIEHTDVYPIAEHAPQPQVFEFAFPNPLVHEILIKDKTWQVEGARATYVEDHIYDVEDPKIQRVIELRIMMSSGNDLACSIHYDVSYKFDINLQEYSYVGTITTEYTQDGKRISPRNISLDTIDYYGHFASIDEVSIESIRNLLGDQQATEVPMTLKDIYDMVQLLGYIHDAPRQNE